MRKDGAEFKGKQEIISRHLFFWEGLATFFLGLDSLLFDVDPVHRAVQLPDARYP